MKRTPYPKSVVIETTLRCNLHCIHCLAVPRRRQYNADMHPDILEMIWPIVEQAEDVSLSNQGEFFCTKNHLAIFRAVRDMGKTTSLATNASLVGDEIIEDVLLGGIDHLDFSIDGVDAATHESLRRGSDFEELIATIRKVCKRKDELKSAVPHVGINFVARRGNIEQLPAMVDLARQLGAGLLNVIHLFVLDRELEQESLYCHQELSDRCFIKARERNRNGSLELRLPGLFSEDAKHGRRRFRKCTFPMYSVIIGAQGEVFACCDWRMLMGDLRQESFDEIWNSERFRRLRKTVNSRRPPKICANCAYPSIANVTNPATHFFWELP